jgi:DNA-binding LytR/AlgR family response regulator
VRKWRYVRVLGRDGSSLKISEEDILYFSSHQNTIYVHTPEGECILPTTLSDLYAAYQELGFERLDRSNVVNMDNTSTYDSARKVVHFTGSLEFATVSEANEKKVKKYVLARGKGMA